MMRRARAKPRDSTEGRGAAEVTRRRVVPEGRSAGQPADANDPAERRLYVPGRLLTDDNVDEIAKEIVDALRNRDSDRR